MKLNGFSSRSDAFENNCFVLRLFFVCQTAKISRDTSVRARIFSGGFFFISSRRVEIYFNSCKNQSKEIHVLFVIFEP